MTQEQWLHDFVTSVRTIFHGLGKTPPAVKVTTNSTVMVSRMVHGVLEIHIRKDDMNVAETVVQEIILHTDPWHPYTLASLVGYDFVQPHGDRFSGPLQAIIERMPPFPSGVTREQWHNLFVDEMKLWFEASGFDFPEISVFQVQLGSIIGSVHLDDGRYHIYFVARMRNTLEITQILLNEIARCVAAWGDNADLIVKKVMQDHNILTSIIDRIGPYPEK